MKELDDIEYVVDKDKSTKDALIIGVRSKDGNCSSWLEIDTYVDNLLRIFQILEKEMRHAYITDKIVKIPAPKEIITKHD